MRFLVDANLSPRVAAGLRSAGHDATHVGDEGLLTADDESIMAHASSVGRVIVSADSDFATLLAVTGRGEPSFVLLRSADRLTPDQQAKLVLVNLDAVEEDLASGAVVTIGRGHLRARRPRNRAGLRADCAPRLGRGRGRQRRDAPCPDSRRRHVPARA